MMHKNVSFNDTVQVFEIERIDPCWNRGLFYSEEDLRRFREDRHRERKQELEQRILKELGLEEEGQDHAPPQHPACTKISSHDTDATSVLDFWEFDQSDAAANAKNVREESPATTPPSPQVDAAWEFEYGIW